VLLDLSSVVRAVAVVTGRPARQVLALGGLEEVGREIAVTGHELYVFGQYGFERWSSTSRRVVSPRPPQGLSGFLAELPQVLRDAGVADAFIEDKGLAFAVHTRRLDDPAGALERLEPRLRDLAGRHEMTIEPGRNVIEARSPGMDKGSVVRDLAADLQAGGFLFAGDDLGDLEAFAAVEGMRAEGLPTLLVCSASEEESALVARSDVIVRGPDGVLDLLRRLAADARA
jgi:trehalose 6-phosphate phosphatase